jgi:hypothetical protein
MSGPSITALLAELAALREELSEALVKGGQEGGFWGKATAREVFKRKQLETQLEILRGALEDIASADETSTLDGAVAIARHALELTK